MIAPLRTNFRSPQPVNVESTKRMAYVEHGILVVSIDDPAIPWHAREILRQIGDSKYGSHRGSTAPLARSAQ